MNRNISIMGLIILKVIIKINIKNMYISNLKYRVFSPVIPGALFFILSLSLLNNVFINQENDIIKLIHPKRMGKKPGPG
ncbi:MAG: hypothetical protein M1308_17470 [Actinobacteria bacterium]|nr:hypothetical protein [Actinomycetota bacterium]